MLGPWRPWCRARPAHDSLVLHRSCCGMSEAPLSKILDTGGRRAARQSRSWSIEDLTGRVSEFRPDRERYRETIRCLQDDARAQSAVRSLQENSVSGVVHDPIGWGAATRAFCQPDLRVRVLLPAREGGHAGQVFCNNLKLALLGGDVVGDPFAVSQQAGSVKENESGRVGSCTQCCLILRKRRPTCLT